MEAMSPAGSIDTTAAEAYEQHMVPGMFLPWTRVLIERAAPKAGERLLDVACGTGIAARLAAPLVGAAGKVVGLDIDAGCIEIARRIARDMRTPNEWHCASALGMPFAAGTFDLCLCQQGLQFFPDRLKGFAEIRRVLKPSGRLAASLWTSLEDNKGHQAVVQALERQNVDTTSARRAFTFGHVQEIRDTASRAGFGNVELRTEDGMTAFASLESFLEGMTQGSPSARHSIALLSDEARARFFDDVREMLSPYVISGGALAYPTRTHILVARTGA
jgi:ubiquinone/menaquinone biosynthesis C-methylase UbiE